MDGASEETEVAPTDPSGSRISVGMWIGMALRLLFFPVAILWPAGTWRWWEGWALVAVWMIYALVAAVYLGRNDPALLKERMKSSPAQEGQKGWDKVMMIAMLLAGLAMIPIPGFDVVRFQWSHPLPLWLELTALAAHVPAFGLLLWVMRANTYLARVVKIDESRGHEVITTGPYAIVRHPMYVAVIALLMIFPLALGSRWGLIPAGLMAALIVVRTALEDRTLHEELEGYREYAEQTRYRLIPGIW